MLRRCTLMIGSLVLLAPMALVAQQKTTGTYATLPGDADEMDLPNDQILQQSGYRMVVFATNPASPLNNISSHCTSATVAAGDGAVVSNSGFCYNMDAAGNGYSMWWQETEAGTSSCPTRCGQFGLYAGHGKFKGMTGMGTWRAGSVLADGTGMGTWELTSQKK